MKKLTYIIAATLLVGSIGCEESVETVQFDLPTDVEVFGIAPHEMCITYFVVGR